MNVIETRDTRYGFGDDHYAFEAPSDSEIPIWRYMDFTKFVSMLESNALYFCRTDLLGDPWEGSLTRSEADKRNRMEEKMKVARLHESTQAKVRSEITNSIASCWHMNEYESMAMWRLYVSTSEGVAVRSTYKGLTESFPQLDSDIKERNEDGTLRVVPIYVGEVKYVDYEAPTRPAGPRWMLKRKSFEHEREIRAIAMDTSWGNSPSFDDEGEPRTRFEGGGDFVPVDLDRLVKEIYVSPEAQPWFHRLVQSVVERYKRSWPVRQSDLGRDPVF